MANTATIYDLTAKEYMLQAPVKLTTLRRFKLTSVGRCKLTTRGRSKLTT